MKKDILRFAAVSMFALALAGCAQEPTSQPDPGAPIIVDDECPRADGEDCR